MKGKRHYIKIPYTVAPWVPGGATGDWQTDIWKDVTEEGQQLVVEYLTPNARGDRSALHGDRFYVEIGRDRDRQDTVFLMKIKPAESQLPRTIPESMSVALRQWPGESPPELDDVSNLFKQTEPTETPLSPPVQPSPLLWSLLAAMPTSTRERFRPGTDLEEPIDPESFLLPLRQLRSRHRLDTQLQLSPRQDLLLRTRTIPKDLPRSERDGILDAFGFSLLNALALDGQNALQAVLDSLASLAIRPHLRATVWAETLKNLPIDDLRRELHASADALAVLACTTPARDIWQRAIASPLLQIATTQDPVLYDLLADGSTDTNLLALLAEWAGKLAFSDPLAVPTPVPAEVPAEVPAPPPPSSTTVRPRSVLDDWVMTLRLPQRDTIERLRIDLSEAARVLRTPDSTPLTVESLLAFDQRTSSLAELLVTWRTTLGDAAALRDDFDDCRSAYEELRLVLPREVSGFLRDSYVLPAEAREIARLLQHDRLADVPDWLFPSGDDADSSPPETPIAWARFLRDSQRRRRTQMFCDLATELNEPLAVTWLAPPTTAVDPEVHLREWFDRVRAFLLELPAEMRELLGESHDLQRAEDEARLVNHLQDVFPPAIWSKLWKEVQKTPTGDRLSLLEASSRAVAFFHNELDGVEDQRYAAIRKRIARELALSSQKVGEDSLPSYAAVTVEHNYLEGGTRRATLIFVPSDTGADYGTVEVPLTLQTKRPRPLSIRLDWTFKGSVRLGWPKDWPNPEPGIDRVISLPVVDWKKQPDGRLWHHPLRAQLPVRTPKEAHPRVELEVSALDTDSGRPLGPSRNLKWESIGLSPVPVTVVWGDGIVPSHVRNHPIGPQERADSLFEGFAAGSSVAIIAPRRFGKTTLLEYLVREGPKHKLCVPPALVCTRYRSGPTFDYESLWKTLSDSLVDKLGTRLKHETAARLPSSDAFRPVRVAARKKGYKAIVILLDEAQLFFTGPKGELGSQLKTLLERSLARTDQRTMAPVVLGLVGLPSLRDRGGADLMGLLNPVEKSTMDEAELSPLIAKMTTGLQTTRGARQKLAQTAGNLFLLRELLRSLADRASRMGRLWVDLDDVVAVEEVLRKGLSEGREQTVASYVRDVLNAADSVDDWRPVPSLGVAAAWAHVWAPARPDGELQERALTIVNEWCRMSYGAGPSGVMPLYTTELLHQHLGQLRKRRVLEGAQFASPLLMAWLAGVARRRDFDDGFRYALFSGAQQRIRIPSGASEVAQGAEAVVWRSGDYAYRVRQLSGAQQREEFQESVSMLEGLRRVVARREAGSDHLFELVEMGLSEKSETEAIQVYRWIEGRSLEHHARAFAADKVVELGTKLTRAVGLLHGNGLLHRDICPRNIVLDDVSDPATARPVLIDFGFARMVTSAMRSAYAGPHIAPEVRKTVPEWGRPADIYALAWSLESLLDPAEPAEALRESLRQGMDDSAEGRPTAEKLLDDLERLERENELNERRERAWREIWGTVKEHRHLPWFGAQMNKSREHLVGGWLRHYRLTEQRAGVVADFLNQLTEGAPSVGRSLWSLGQSEGDENLKTLGALRNRFVHGGVRETEDQRALTKRFASAKRDRQRAVMVDGVGKVARMCGLKSLPALGERLAE